MKKRKTAGKMAAAAMAFALLLSGCGSIQNLLSGAAGEKEYGKSETMIIVTTERSRYEDLYTDAVWDTTVDDKGTTFEESLLSQIHSFLKELKTMSLMADEETITLSAKEKELAKEAANTYLENLKSSGSSFEIEESVVESLYEDYWKANKLVESLTDSANLEVSDSEAKVIVVDEIACTDSDKAREILAQVQTQGSDFLAIARENSKDSVIEKKLYRGQHGSDYEKAAYALSTGQISDIINENGTYYILKCVSDYDEAATRLRKEEMIREKKNEAFYETYADYAKNVHLATDENLWKNLSIREETMGADFFEIFQTVCAETK